jgi:hypothetical protein
LRQTFGNVNYLADFLVSEINHPESVVIDR